MSHVHKIPREHYDAIHFDYSVTTAAGISTGLLEQHTERATNTGGPSSADGPESRCELARSAIESGREGEAMRCDRCHRETLVERHDIDGFTGHLCEECRRVWERLQRSKHLSHRRT